MANEMGIMDQVIDFFTRLLRGRIDGASIQARSKIKNVEVQARNAASRHFNGAIDGAMAKGKAKAADVAAKRKPAPGDGETGEGDPPKE